MRPTPGTCAIYLRVLYWLLVLVHLSPHHFTKLLGVRCILWRSLRKDCCTSGLKLEWFLWLTTGLNMRILPTVSTKNFPQIQRSHKSLSFPNAKNNYSKYIHTCIYIYICPFVWIKRNPECLFSIPNPRGLHQQSPGRVGVPWSDMSSVLNQYHKIDGSETPWDFKHKHFQNLGVE